MSTGMSSGTTGSGCFHDEGSCTLDDLRGVVQEVLVNVMQGYFMSVPVCVPLQQTTSGSGAMIFASKSECTSSRHSTAKMSKASNDYGYTGIITESVPVVSSSLTDAEVDLSCFAEIPKRVQEY
eukprot:Lankesteria_metandrocarpae@DN8226_c0_g1_i1.p1